MRPSHALAAGALAMQFGGAVRAEDAPASSMEDRKAARELMREGNALYAAGDTRNAYDRYRAAWVRARGFDVACNLGRAAAELGRARDAAEYLDYCLRHYSLSSREEVVQAEHEIRETLESVRARVGMVTAHTEPAGAEISVDGVMVGRDPLEAPIFVDPGEHRVRAELAGHGAAEAAISVPAGSQNEARLSLPAAVPFARAPVRAAMPEGPDRVSSGSPSYVPAAIAGALTVASVGVGVGFFVAAGDKELARDDRLAQLSGTNRCGEGTVAVIDCAAINRAANQAETYRAISYASFGVAAAGAVATFILWPKRTARPATGLWVSPIAGAGTAGVSAAASF